MFISTIDGNQDNGFVMMSEKNKEVSNCANVIQSQHHSFIQGFAGSPLQNRDYGIGIEKAETLPKIDIARYVK